MTNSTNITSDPIGAWKCNFPFFKEIMTDPRINQLDQDNQPTDRRSHRKLTLQISMIIVDKAFIVKHVTFPQACAQMEFNKS